MTGQEHPAVYTKKPQRGGVTEHEQLVEDAETLERAADIVRRERTKRTFMVDVLLRVLTDMAAKFRSDARKIQRL